MIDIKTQILKKNTCKAVNVRSLHTIRISNSEKTSFNIFLKKFQGVFIPSLC